MALVVRTQDVGGEVGVIPNVLAFLALTEM